MEYSLRIEQDRDMTISIREDMVLDLVDCLQVIKTEDGYQTDPKLNTLWRVEELSDKEIPGNLVFDQESEVECNASNWKHKLLVTLEHVTADGQKTSSTLNKGVQDMLRAIGEIEDRFCEKYSTDPMKLVSTLKGVESTNKTMGVMDAVLQIGYKTAKWKF